MAKAFNLTAQINLQGPTNIKPVVAQIKRELEGINTSVNVKFDPKAAKGVDALSQRVQNLNRILIETTKSSQILSSSLNGLGTSIKGLGTIGKINTVVGKTSQAINQTAKASKVAASEMEEFGKQSALAIRRLAAFSVVSAGVLTFANALRNGTKAFIEFDKQLIRLQQVTQSGAIGIQSLKKQIIELSTTLGVSSETLTQVAVTLAQAGFSAKETQQALAALAKTELAPSFDDITETTEGAIAALRQFGIETKDLEKILGSINAVAAAFAVESSDIISAIQRAGGAFAASSKGISEGSEALNEFIALFTSVRATTRESAETIATGLRTIFTRIQRGSTIDFLREFGVELTDFEGKFVGPFEAIKRLSSVLKTLDPRDLRFSQIVEELGGFRQIGKVIPLIQQFSEAQKALGVAQRGQGSLTEAQVKAQQSLANQIARVREEFLALSYAVGDSATFRGLFNLVLGITSGLLKLANVFKPILPLLATLAVIQGGKAITKFSSGFIGGLKKGGLSKGVSKGIGNSLGKALSGASGESKAIAAEKTATALKDNTNSIQTLTAAVQSLTQLLNSRGPGPTGLNGGGKVLAFARGGSVPGSGNRDTVPAMLMPGEFVLRKKAVETIGSDRLHSMNKYGSGGNIKTGKYSNKPQRFIRGGTVEETAQLENLTAEESVVSWLRELGGISGIKKIGKIQKGDRNLNSVLNLNNIRSGKPEKLAAAIEVINKALTNKTARKAREAQSINKSLKLGVVGLEPLGFSKDQAFKTGIGKAALLIRGLPNEPQYKNLVGQTRNDLDQVSTNLATNLQSANAFGGNQPIALDFDETLVKGADIFGADGKPDIPAYDNLDKVKEALKNGQPTELAEKLKSIIDFDPSFIDKIRVLTARPQESANLLAEKLNSIGLPIPASKIQGTRGGGSTKATKLGVTEKLIDDNYDNIMAAISQGKTAKQYAELRELEDAETRAGGIANAEGAILQLALSKLGAQGGTIKEAAVDFNKGLGLQASQIFGLPPDIPTEVKRTISSASIGRAKEEFKRYFKENTGPFPKGSDVYSIDNITGLPVSRFNNGGRVRGSYTQEDIAKRASEIGMTAEELTRQLEERQNNHWKDYVIPEYNIYKKFGLTPSKTKSPVQEAMELAEAKKYERIEKAMEKRGKKMKEYEGRTTEEKEFRKARGYNLGGIVQKFMAGGSVKETRSFGSGAFPFPKRISNAYFKEIDAKLNKEQVDKAFSGGTFLDYPKDFRLKVDQEKAAETFDSIPFSRNEFADSFKGKLATSAVYRRMSDFAKFIGLPKEDLSLALPRHIDFSDLGLRALGQFDRTGMGTKLASGYDLSNAGYTEGAAQDLYGYEKLVAEKQKEFKKIIKTPVKTFDDGSFQYDEALAKKTWDEINDLQMRIMNAKKVKNQAELTAIEQMQATAKTSGRGAITMSTGPLSSRKNDTFYHEMTHQLIQGLRTRSSESFDKYKSRVVSLFSGDNNDLADAFDALESSYNSSDVVYGRSYKVGALDQVIQQNRSINRGSRPAKTPEAAATASTLWAKSLGIKKARDFKPINPEVNQALLDNSISQSIIDRFEDSGKEEFLTTLVQNAPKLDPILQASLDSTLNELLSSAGVQRQQYNKGGSVGSLKRFAKGGSAQDTVPALLTPGEFVINKKAAQKIGYGKLHKMNKADKLQGYNKGGVVAGIQKFAKGGDVTDSQEWADVVKQMANLAAIAKDLPDFQAGLFALQDNLEAAGKVDLAKQVAEVNYSTNYDPESYMNSLTSSKSGKESLVASRASDPDDPSGALSRLAEVLEKNIKVQELFAVSAEQAGNSLEEFQTDIKNKILEQASTSEAKRKGSRLDLRKEFTRASINYSPDQVRDLDNQDKIRTSLTESLSGLLDPADLNSAISEIIDGLGNGAKSLEEIAAVSPEVAKALDAARDRAEAMASAHEMLESELGGLTDAVRVSKEEFDAFEYKKSGNAEKDFGMLGGMNPGAALAFKNSASGSRLLGAAKGFQETAGLGRLPFIGKGLGSLSKVLGNLPGPIGAAVKAVGGLPGAFAVLSSIIGSEFLPMLLKAAGAADSEVGAGIGGALAQGGSTAVSMGTLGNQLAGPIGGMIGTITGAVAGAIKGFSDAFRTKALSNALNRLSSQIESVDKAFENLARKNTVENVMAAQKETAGLTATMADLEAGSQVSGGQRAADAAFYGIIAGGIVAAIGAGLMATGIGLPAGGVITAGGIAMAGGATAVGVGAGAAGLGMRDNINDESLEGFLKSVTAYVDRFKKLADIQIQNKNLSQLEETISIINSIDKDLANNKITPKQAAERKDAEYARLGAQSSVIEQAQRGALMREANIVVDPNQSVADAVGGDPMKEAIVNNATRNTAIALAEEELNRKYDASTEDGRTKILKEMKDKEALYKRGLILAGMYEYQAASATRLSIIMKQMSIETENLVQAFNKALAGIGRFKDDLENIVLKIEDNAAFLTGEATMGRVDRTQENMLRNSKAYTTEELEPVLANVESLAGGGEQGRKLTDSIKASRVFEEVLPDIIRNAGARDVGEVTREVTGQLEGLGIGDEVIRSLVGELDDYLSAETGNRSGNSFEEVLTDMPALANAIQTAKKAQEVGIAILEAQNDALDAVNQQLDIYNKYLRKSLEYSIKADQIRLQGAIELDRALGRDVSLERLNAPFETEIKALTGGTMDPVEIANTIRDNQIRDEELRGRPGNFANNLNNTGLIAESVALGQESQKATEELIKEQAELARSSNNAYDALEKLASSGDIAANILSKIESEREQGRNTIDFVRKISTQSAEDAVRMQRSFKAFDLTLKGGLNLGNRENRNLAYEGMDSLLPLLKGSETGNKIISKFTKQMLVGQGVDINKPDAFGSGKTLSELIDAGTTGIDPGTQELIKLYEKSIGVQEEAARQLSNLNGAAAQKHLGATEIILTQLYNNLPMIIASALENPAAAAAGQVAPPALPVVPDPVPAIPQPQQAQPQANPVAGPAAPLNAAVGGGAPNVANQVNAQGLNAVATVVPKLDLTLLNTMRSIDNLRINIVELVNNTHWLSETIKDTSDIMKSFTTFNEATIVFGTKVDLFNTTTVSFGSYVDKLSKAAGLLSDAKITMGGSYTVDVKVSGAAAFQAIEEGTQKLIDKEIGLAMGELVNKIKKATGMDLDLDRR